MSRPSQIGSVETWVGKTARSWATEGSSAWEESSIDFGFGNLHTHTHTLEPSPRGCKGETHTVSLQTGAVHPGSVSQIVGQLHDDCL